MYKSDRVFTKCSVQSVVVQTVNPGVQEVVRTSQPIRDLPQGVLQLLPVGLGVTQVLLFFRRRFLEWSKK